MNTSKLAFLIIVPLLINMRANAQEYAFKILVNKGKNEVKAGSAWQPLKVGASLKSLDEIKVAENSYLGLVHASGKPLELKQSGKYKVSDLASKVSGGTSVLNKYTDFILSVNEHKTSMAVTGSVNRGTDYKLNLPQPDKALIYNDEIIISWDEPKFPGPYIVKFNSLFEDELQKIETSDKYVRINLNDKYFQHEDNIIVQVLSQSDGTKSEKYTLKKLSQADHQRISNALQEIDQQTSEENALNKFLMAGFFEQNHLLIDAITAYNEAIALAPDVLYYKEAYNDFLLRHQIKEPPAKK